MAEIIEPAQDSFETRCTRCMCRFRYKLDELTKNYGTLGTGEYIACPGCSTKVDHRPNHGKLGPLEAMLLSGKALKHPV